MHVFLKTAKGFICITLLLTVVQIKNPAKHIFHKIHDVTHVQINPKF